MPRHDDDLLALLTDAGIPSDAIAAVQRIDALMAKWRRNMIKRDFGHQALAALELDIDLAQADVLFAIAAPHNEFGEGAGTETMVGTVAERLGIDPSRASRVVSEMVAAGNVRRAASQADGRRTILELTERGSRIVRAIQAYKWLLLGDHLSQWPGDEVAAFLPLLEKFSEWTTASDKRESVFADEIASLVDSVRSVPAPSEAEPV